MASQIKHIDLDNKTCNRCKEIKPADFKHFSPHKNSLNSICKICAALTQKEYRLTVGKEELRKRSRKYSLKGLYNMTIEEYANLLKKQNGVCAICKQKPNPRNTRPSGLSVDHDHSTGEVRGLLCDLCNRALGLFSDDSSILMEAFWYLEETRKNG